MTVAASLDDLIAIKPFLSVLVGQVHPSVAVAVLLTCNRTMDGVILMVFAVLDSVDAIPWLAVDRRAIHGWQWIDEQLADESMIALEAMRFSRLAVFPAACQETVPMPGGN